MANEVKAGVKADKKDQAYRVRLLGFITEEEIDCKAVNVGRTH
jgi:hypothetical protein